MDVYINSETHWTGWLWPWVRRWSGSSRCRWWPRKWRTPSRAPPAGWCATGTRARSCAWTGTVWLSAGAWTSYRHRRPRPRCRPPAPRSCTTGCGAAAVRQSPRSWASPTCPSPAWRCSAAARTVWRLRNTTSHNIRYCSNSRPWGEGLTSECCEMTRKRRRRRDWPSFLGLTRK